MGGPPSGPRFGGDMAKILGENSAFSASLEMRNGPDMVLPGKIAYLQGKSRFEMDMTEMKSGAMPPQAAAQMKQMGMDKIIVISRPDKSITCMIYPGLQAYVENPIQDPDAAKPPNWARKAWTATPVSKAKSSSPTKPEKPTNPRCGLRPI
jgi:hypothetical protein